MKVRVALATLATTAVLVSPAGGAGPIRLRPGLGGVPDPGAIDCAMFNKIYPNGPSGLRQATLYWLEGLVYGRTGKTLDEFLADSLVASSWNFETLTDHIVNFCAADPAAPVSSAVEDLWRRLDAAPGTQP